MLVLDYDTQEKLIKQLPFEVGDKVLFMPHPADHSIPDSYNLNETYTLTRIFRENHLTLCDVKDHCGYESRSINHLWFYPKIISNSKLARVIYGL